jgi:hypothetical protein
MSPQRSDDQARDGPSRPLSPHSGKLPPPPRRPRDGSTTDPPIATTPRPDAKHGAPRVRVSPQGRHPEYNSAATRWHSWTMDDIHDMERMREAMAHDKRTPRESGHALKTEMCVAATKRECKQDPCFFAHDELELLYFRSFVRCKTCPEAIKPAASCYFRHEGEQTILETVRERPSRPALGPEQFQPLTSEDVPRGSDGVMLQTVTRPKHQGQHYTAIGHGTEKYQASASADDLHGRDGGLPQNSRWFKHRCQRAGSGDRRSWDELFGPPSCNIRSEPRSANRLSENQSRVRWLERPSIIRTSRQVDESAHGRAYFDDPIGRSRHMLGARVHVHDEHVRNSRRKLRRTACTGVMYSDPNQNPRYAPNNQGSTDQAGHSRVKRSHSDDTEHNSSDGKGAHSKRQRQLERGRDTGGYGSKSKRSVNDSTLESHRGPQRQRSVSWSHDLRENVTQLGRPSKEDTLEPRIASATHGPVRGIDRSMTLRDWKVMEREMISKGGVDALAFKVIRDALLSRNIGAPVVDLGVLNEILARVPIRTSRTKRAVNVADFPKCALMPTAGCGVWTERECGVLQRTAATLLIGLDPFFDNCPADLGPGGSPSDSLPRHHDMGVVRGWSNGIRRDLRTLPHEEVLRNVPPTAFHKNSVLRDEVFLSLRHPNVAKQLRREDGW